MKQKTLLALLVVLGLMLLSVACGGTAAPAAEPADSAPAAEASSGEEASAPADTAAEAPVAEQIELTMWMHQNPAFIAANEEIISRFEAQNPGVTIKLETFDYGVFVQTLQTSMPAGTEADIIEMFGSWVCSYADRLSAMPDSIMSYEQAQEQFFAAPLDGYYCDQALRGLPNEFNIESGAVLVNRRMFEEAGLTYPPQWETTADLLADAQALTVSDGDFMTTAGYQFISGDGLPFVFLAGIIQRGGEYWNEDFSGVQFNTPEARASLEDMKAWVDSGVVDPLLFNNDTNQPLEAFFSEQAAISFIGPWAVPVGRENFADVEFDYVRIPPYAGDQPLFVADAGWGKVVSARSPHQDMAFKFVEFATANMENALFWNTTTGTIPALKAAAADPALLEQAPWFAASLEILDQGRNIGPFPDRDKFWYDIAYKYLVAALQGEMTVDEALSAIETETNATFQ